MKRRSTAVASRCAVSNATTTTTTHGVHAQVLQYTILPLLESLRVELCEAGYMYPNDGVDDSRRKAARRRAKVEGAKVDRG